MKHSLVIQSYGSTNEYKRAIFSIWSFYAWTNKLTDQVRVILFTDNAEYFRQHLKTLSVKFISLSPDKLKSMRGKIDFVHRVKIAAIEEAFEHTEENLLYTDSDTFFTNDALFYLEKVSPQRAFIHKNEYPLKELKNLKLPAGRTFHIFYDFVMSRPFTLVDGTSFMISPDQISWNAGVIILHQTHRKLLADVYKLTEDFYPSTQNHGCEQYAFSIVLDRFSSVAPCEDLIYHYWVLVKKKIVDIFLESRICDNWSEKSYEEKKTLVRKWTLLLPKFIENHVLMLRYQAIQAFHENRYTNGYRFALRALIKQPFYLKFYMDVAYHLKRHFLSMLNKAFTNRLNSCI